MWRLPRFRSAADLKRIDSRSPVCRACQLRSASLPRRAAFTTKVPHQYAGRSHSHTRSPQIVQTLPFTEKVRRKIWGTDNPPGQKDPYSDKERAESLLPEERELEEAEEALASEEGAYTSGEELINNKDYKPASSWEDLEWVGSQEWVEAQQEAPATFQGFMPETKVTEPEEIKKCLLRALVEILVLRDAQQPYEHAWTAQTPPKNWESVEADFRFGTGPNGKTVLQYLSQNSRIELLQQLEVAEVENLSAVPETDAVPEGPSLDDAWLRLSIQDPAVKFAVTKRLMQLTGIQIPDPAIQQSKTAGTLYQHLLVKPKPKRLAESLEMEEELVSLPNVTLLDRRYTPIDREKSVGRWKVIEKELVERGLPVTGHNK